MANEICKHEWVGEAWKPETQSCKKCHISWYEAYPKIVNRIETATDERRRLCNLTVSGNHIWRSVITNPEDVKKGLQPIMREKCFACGIVDDMGI